MDARVVSFYRHIFSDLTLDRSEATELVQFLQKLNPPPDKLTWLRATAFKTACDYLSGDSHESNVSLLRTINAIVHAIETTCLEYVDRCFFSICFSLLKFSPTPS